MEYTVKLKNLSKLLVVCEANSQADAENYVFNHIQDFYDQLKNIDPGDCYYQVLNESEEDDSSEE